MKKQRIGLFGGAFDPIHIGHLELAEIAMEEGRLDRVLFIPSNKPPHKNELFASFNQRVAMISMAIESRIHFELSDIESKVDGISYTYDVLKILESQLSKGDELFFLIGTDAFLEIESWKLYEKLFSTINFFIIKRDVDNFSILESFLNRVGYEKITSGEWQHKNSEKKVLISEKMPITISSSAIRSDFKRGESSNHLASDVAMFIQKEKIYSTN